MADKSFQSHEIERSPEPKAGKGCIRTTIFSTKDKEREAYENNTFWFNDALHYPEPLYPFDIIWDEAWFLGLSQFNTRIFMIPPVYGLTIASSTQCLYFSRSDNRS